MIINKTKNNINKIKLDKAPLSCKNKINNIFKKENKEIKENKENKAIKDKNNINNNKNTYSNLKRIKINSINKTNSSIIIKKNKTFLNLKEKNKNSSIIKTKSQTKKKIFPSKKSMFPLINKKIINK